jgi:hypothetical protein
VTKSNAQHLYLQQRKPTDAIQTYHQNVHKWAHQNPNRSTKGINQTSQKCNTKNGGKGECRICIAAAADPTEPDAAPSPYPRIAPILTPLKHPRSFPPNPRRSTRNQEIYQRKGGTEGRTPTDRPRTRRRSWRRRAVYPACPSGQPTSQGTSRICLPSRRRRRTPTDEWTDWEQQQAAPHH